MGLRAFFGILPPRLPYSRSATDLGAAPAPAHVVLIGEGSLPDIAVAVGQQVQTGQDLARRGAGPLLATVTGKVTRIEACTGGDGGPAVAVTIAAAAQEVQDPGLAPVPDPEHVDPTVLREVLARSGLPPLAALRFGARIRTVIASGLDEAPGCAVNRSLLAADAAAVATGLQILRRASGAERTVLAWPADSRAPAGLPAEVVLDRVPPAYPHGLPELLAVRQGGWLLQRTPAGVVGDSLVVGLEHLLAMVAFVTEGRPFVTKTVSCLGPRDREPRNVTVRIGTPAAQVLRLLGLTPQSGGKLLLGSPLRATACPDADRPIRPDTQQLVLQDPPQVHRFQRTTCTNCGLCDQICPVGLQVNLLGRFAEYDRYDRCADLAVERCVDCGLCAYVCPARRPLAQLMMHAKQTLWRSPERRQAEVDTAGCNACGPSCPAIRLFDLDGESAPQRQETRS